MISHVRSPNTDGEKYIRKFDDPVNNFKPQSEEEHESHNQVLNNICAKFGEHLDNFQNSRSTLRFAAI